MNKDIKYQASLVICSRPQSQTKLTFSVNSLLKIDENFDIEEKMRVILLIIKRQPQLNIICICTQDVYLYF